MANPKQKQSFIDSFRIIDRKSCEKAIRYGGIAAMISAAITGIFAVAGFFTSSSNKYLAYYLDPWLAVDMVLIIVLGLFVFRKSRIASTLLVIYFVVSKVITWSDVGIKPQGLLISVIFLLYYANAMRGTYIWHAEFAFSSQIDDVQKDRVKKREGKVTSSKVAKQKKGSRNGRKRIKRGWKKIKKLLFEKKVKWTCLILSILVIIGLLFYWYEYRPSRARKECVKTAEERAILLMKSRAERETWNLDYKEAAEKGWYLTSDYEYAYKQCLRLHGIEK